MSLLDPEDRLTHEISRDGWSYFRRGLLVLGLFFVIGTYIYSRSPQPLPCEKSAIIDYNYNINGSIYGGVNIENNTFFVWPIRIPPQELLRSPTTFCTKDHKWAEFSDYSETLRFQQLLHRFQNPLDCAKAKFLLRLEQWEAGFGSAIHTISSVMMKSFAHRRIYVESPDQQWSFAATHCYALKSSSECYFLPLSHCPLPKDWKSLGEPEHENNPWNAAGKVKDAKESGGKR